MRRREFLGLLDGATAVWSHAAQAQPSGMPVIGYLGSSSLVSSADQLAGFRLGLDEASYVEGRNFTIEYRWSDGHYDRLPAMAAEFVRRPVAVIVASGLPAALAAKAATATIPILFVMRADHYTGNVGFHRNEPA